MSLRIIIDSQQVEQSRNVDVNAHTVGFECIEISDFFERFDDIAYDCLRNCYLEHRGIETSRNGHLVTSLPSEVFSFVNSQIQVLSEYVLSQNLGYTDACSTLIIEAAISLVENLADRQRTFRTCFHQSFESCCAAANNFVRMMELSEEWLEDLREDHKLDMPPGRFSWALLKQKHEDLVSMYGNDAVYAAQMTNNFIFQPIKERLTNRLFENDWESKLTHNEIALSLVKTIEDFAEDLKLYLSDEIILKKVFDRIIATTVGVYIQNLMLKARKMRKNMIKRKKGFQNSTRAVSRMQKDIEIMKDFFLEEASNLPSLSRTIQQEFSPLNAIFEFVTIIPSATSSDIKGFVSAMMQVTGNFDLTRRMLLDLCLLFAPKKQRIVNQTMLSIKKDLVHERLQNRGNQPQVLRFVTLLANLYGIKEERLAMCWK